jgi:hypothetical protein
LRGSATTPSRATQSIPGARLATTAAGGRSFGGQLAARSSAALPVSRGAPLAAARKTASRNEASRGATKVTPPGP